MRSLTVFVSRASIKVTNSSGNASEGQAGSWCLLRTVFPFICETGSKKEEPKGKELCFVLFLDSSAVHII